MIGCTWSLSLPPAHTATQPPAPERQCLPRPPQADIDEIKTSPSVVCAIVRIQPLLLYIVSSYKAPLHIYPLFLHTAAFALSAIYTTALENRCRYSLHNTTAAICAATDASERAPCPGNSIAFFYLPLPAGRASPIQRS